MSGKGYILILLLLCQSQFGFGQDNLNKANTAFNNGNYEKAVDLFNKYQNIAADTDILERRGIANYHLNKLDNAIWDFTKAKKLGSVSSDLFFYMARTKQHQEDYEEATFFYKSYLKLATPEDQHYNLAYRELKNCTFSAFYNNQNTVDLVQSFGTQINTSFDEIFPIQSPQVGNIYYASTNKNKKHFEMVSYALDGDGNWTTDKSFGENLNTQKHDRAVDITGDGMAFLYQKTNASETSVHYFSTFDNENNRIDIELPYDILLGAVDIFIIDHNTLAFASDQLEGHGGYDIFTIEYKDGQWTEALNEGPIINTENDERSPFYARDGRHIYFSSNRPYCYGGFDIYHVANTVKNPVAKNVGKPINSVGNDLGFRLDQHGHQAVFMSDRKTGEGGYDLYFGYMQEIKKLIPVDTMQFEFISDYFSKPDHEVLLAAQLKKQEEEEEKTLQEQKELEAQLAEEKKQKKAAEEKAKADAKLAEAERRSKEEAEKKEAKRKQKELEAQLAEEKKQMKAAEEKAKEEAKLAEAERRSKEEAEKKEAKRKQKELEAQLAEEKKQKKAAEEKAKEEAKKKAKLAEAENLKKEKAEKAEALIKQKELEAQVAEKERQKEKADQRSFEEANLALSEEETKRLKNIEKRRQQEERKAYVIKKRKEAAEKERNEQEAKLVEVEPKVVQEEIIPEVKVTEKRPIEKTEELVALNNQSDKINLEKNEKDRKIKRRAIDDYTIFYEDRHDLLQSKNREKMVELGIYLNENPKHKVCLIAHTDQFEPGLPEFVQYNTLKRAKKIAELLVKEGINKNRISIESVAANYPIVRSEIAGKENEENIHLNKRIDFQILNENGAIIEEHNVDPKDVPTYSLDRRYELYKSIREELYYSVKIAGAKRIFKNAILRLYNDIYVRKETLNSENEYYIGLYTNVKDAILLKESLEDSSSPMHEIVPFYNGRKIEMSDIDALKIEYPDLADYEKLLSN